MPSSLVTSLLWADPDETLVAKVLGVKPSATTYLLGCTPEPDGRDCGLHAALTLGPWASETPPPGAARAGDFDLDITDSIYPWTFSMHCEMSGTVPQKCTTINFGGNNDGHPTATFGSEEDGEEEELGGFGYATVTITEGLELLAATYSSSHETTAASTEETSAGASSTAESAASATATSSETGGTESSSGTSTPEATSAAAFCETRVLTAMFVAGLAMAMVFS
ncbi:hypothetical protein NW754_002506 [Fusarium falciforme]|uniref:Uncharacterized protein n=1 Tax=Fusarium falciforme TaxID=195108 RepID=A0A9W8V182_9HYPO|nr:hypothetical protein NW754_002506 [Fusarium falciforme]KAJ4183407.1 hypothetical protein NW767_013573 [Fusarium falciforme]KAJ4186721.1 hypothetical protein NW755_007452 [Fusarium falciforme]KAJ4247607.1 hypothetical protein NW757_008760 [Fusarium falciforme]